MHLPDELPIPRPARRVLRWRGSLPSLVGGWTVAWVGELLSRMVDWPEWWRFVARWLG
jgi:hypothetical protein